MFRMAFRLLILSAPVFFAGCMGVSTEQGAAPEQKNAAVRSGLDLLAQLERATTLNLGNSSVRSQIGTRLGVDGGNGDFGASNVVLGAQIAIGAEDPRGPKIPSSLNNALRIAYVYCDNELALPTLPPIFANVPVTVAPTAATLDAFIKQSEMYFGAEAMGDANRAILAAALLDASTGRTAREAWASACAAVAAGPSADTL